jgi:hypothetical protein
VKAMQSFFVTVRLLKEVNNTFIVLIPKTQSPTSFNHFRPISLCNVVCKTIAKLLVQRLRPLLPNLVASNQSTFIPGRWIAESEVVLQEMLYSLRNRRQRQG